ncbi:hypothetical protein [Mycolicibacterium conceptionense]|uniref:Uncharacterized protein n=2 Tax=Mycobacteriaceae TaxID=1762 RepID=A0ABR5FYH2_9MYCO|nr:hypothetical protein [Mycolicibacterium conceptionense]KLI08924.1 hypothetical protein AA982_05385 [Mycolicibacterium senegalense]KLO53003.1 hypothetical protein ABW05_17370 [Mycolicibacterium senegalense]OMB71753.1 hypothetical protein A5741_06685 [Mycolicibacterium conceptionense]
MSGKRGKLNGAGTPGAPSSRPPPMRVVVVFVVSVVVAVVCDVVAVVSDVVAVVSDVVAVVSDVVAVVSVVVLVVSVVRDVVAVVSDDDTALVVATGPEVVGVSDPEGSVLGGVSVLVAVPVPVCGGVRVPDGCDDSPGSSV